ncbi:MAG: hypothetical protein JO276_07915 [Sphingomonadaceae bacterium]|nr:hypothetical protein [Sphingomonadaceae bacterium]
MRILFYLPVVTPWWFDRIVAPLIDRLVQHGEVHVMVPPLWHGTGIGAEQLAGVVAAELVQWHILDGEDHPRLRSGGEPFDDLVDLVHAIGPDICLCRSADLDTPSRFPGIVRYLMEAGFPPFPAGAEWLVLREHPFDHCVIPALGEADKEALHGGTAELWSAVERIVAAQAHPDGLRDEEGRGADELVLALPLEYENAENFFSLHRPHANSAALVSELAEAVDDGVRLAVTDHPLNLLHCDRSPLEAAVAQHADRVRLVPPKRRGQRPTISVVRASDGMIVSNSKVISIGAFLGKPILRLSNHESGRWLNAYSDLRAFLGGLRDGAPKVPAKDEAKTFFALHAANNIIDLNHQDMDGRLILDMVETPVDPRRWPAGISRYAASHPDIFQ